MTFDEMQTFVRTHADADTTDGPSSSLTVYARMAYNDILTRGSGWPHLEVARTLTTVVNQDAYNFTAFDVPDLDILTGVIDQTGLGRRLVAITRQDADILYGGPTSAGSTTAVHYTIIGDSVVLFPRPTSVKNYLVRGFRTPATWPGAGGSSPDLPRMFDESICWFMLSNYFLAQEDTPLASMYMNEYQQQVDRQIRSEMGKGALPRPNIMGGANRVDRSFMRRVQGMLE